MKCNDTIHVDIVRDVYDDIKRNIVSNESVINDTLRQILELRGKGIRPVFLSLIGELMGGSWEILRKAAMVIETIHIASLIHDDFIDGSEMRRGAATLSVMFSDKISVLYGDYIFIKALDSAREISDQRAVQIIYKAMERMIEGEICEALNDRVIDEEVYLKNSGNKTASLFAASGELGAVLSGCDGVEKKWAGELGESVGMAFQIIDDTLDLTGETVVMGKPRFMDVMSGHLTLPVIHSLKNLPSEEIEKIFANENESVERLTEIVRINRGIEYSFEKANEYLERAKSILERFGNENAVSIFDDFFEMMMTRTS